MAMAVMVNLVLVSTRLWMVSAVESKSSELSDPLGKVNELMNTLKAKIIKEGEEEAKAYEEWVLFCHTASDNLNYEIKNYAKIKEKQEAKIAELASDIDVAESEIEQLSGAISSNQGEIDEATAIRAKQQVDFAATAKELIEVTDALDRAMSIISTQKAKNPAAFVQIPTTVTSLLQSLGNVVDAAGVSSSDSQKLTAFVQSRQEEEGEMGAPAAAAYQSQSGDIINLLDNLKEKAQDELADARKVEASSKNNFALMKQSLHDQMTEDTKDLNLQKSAKADAEEDKSKTEGDVAITMPHLEENKKDLETFIGDCMQSASDHEATVASRTEEVKVITKALEILKEEAAGAGEISRAIFNKYAFLQTASMTKSTMRTRADLANTEVAAMVKKLAREQHSAALAQLASRISVMVKYGEHDSANPFKKIKGLISQMIMKLEKEAEAEATEKSYCDEQMGKTEAQKKELEHDHAKLVNSIDKAVARSTEIKEGITTLHEEIALLSSTIAELVRIRSEQHANYMKAKTDLQDGMAGVSRVADILIKYYGNSAALIQGGSQSRMQASFLEQPAPPEHHEKSSKAGGPIIDILEVVESDFAATLAKEEMQETDAESEFQEIHKEEQESKIAKEKEIQYSKPKLIALEKQISQLANDKETLDSELSAVLQYYALVRGKCVAKPQSYQDRKARREAEISGLQDALSTLESEAAFVQRKRRIRGGIVQ